MPSAAAITSRISASRARDAPAAAIHTELCLFMVFPPLPAAAWSHSRATTSNAWARGMPISLRPRTSVPGVVFQKFLPHPGGHCRIRRHQALGAGVGGDDAFLLQHAAGFLNGVGVYPQQGRKGPAGGQLIPGADGTCHQAALHIPDDLQINRTSLHRGEAVKGDHAVLTALS